MKATTSTPNTLFVALWNEKGRSIALGNFRSELGMELSIDGMGPLIESQGNDSFALLASVLNDAKCLCARHIVIFTNDPALVDVFTFPVRLEPTARGREHLCVPTQWDILRAFCLYESWQCKFADKLPKAQELWRNVYERH